MLVGLLLVLIVVGWYFDWFEPTSTLPVAVEPQPQQIQIQPQVIDSTPTPAAPATTSDAAVPAITADAAAPASAPAAPAVEAPSAAAPVDEAGGPPPVVSETPAAGAAGTLAFRFDTQSWVEVRDASGRVIYAGTNDAGSTRTVQGQAPFRLVVGNARAVQLEHGGQKVDLGPHIRGTVARLTVN
jgi:cytoskeleton protein RodZ